MKKLLAFTALALTAPALAQEEETPVTPTSVVAAASAEEWLAIAPEDLLVMELAPDARGNPRTVVIQLMPPPFSQPWVENIRTLARAHWWDGTSVNRVQDNYVTQWGDVTEDKELPEELIDTDDLPYVADGRAASDTMRHNAMRLFERIENHEPGGPSGLESYDAGEVTLLDYPYGFTAMFDRGIPYSFRMLQHFASDMAPIHCYGYVGVGRNYAPDTGTGADLYAIIGQPQRHMDRNLAVVGRVIEGMEHLSSLPRGSGELGFYTDEEADLRVPILSVRLASEMDEPPSFEYLDTASESFAAYVRVRANRDDPFYTVPAGGVDVCSVLVPVRRVAE